MAADVKARQDRHNTIAFTLPISCQVCLGKVKQPVLCPNNHVFCSQCMDVWLQRNHQCPACRVTITPANPVKQIIGGLNEATADDKDKMSNPELRKARFDLLYKEYEEEFERSYNEIKLLKTENEVLKQQLKSRGVGDSKTKKEFGPQTSDTNGLLLLTKKLQDAQRLYEKVKSELSRTKEENNNLKDENVNLNRENQKLRTEIASRSPHRYGRITVSTLESKLSSYEKEVGQLNKALEKSDQYIADLQAEVDDLRAKDKVRTSTAAGDQPYTSTMTKRSSESYSSRLLPTEPLTSKLSSYDVDADNPSKRQLFLREDPIDDDQGLVNGESSHKYHGNGGMHEQYRSYYNNQHATKTSAKTTSKNGAKVKRVTFDLPRDKNETMSFDLEMPSPLTSKLSLTNGSSDSPMKGVLKNGKKTGDHSDSFNLAKPSLLEDSVENVRPPRSYAKDDDVFATRSARSTTRYTDEDDSLFKTRSDRDMYNESFNLEKPDDKAWSGHGNRDRRSQDFDDTQVIQSELDDLDISVTPDFTDCLKLLNRAEKNVHNRADGTEDPGRGDPVFDKYQPSQDYLGDYNSKTDLPSQDFKSYTSADNFASRPESTYSSKYYSDVDNLKPSVSSGRTDFTAQQSDLALSERYPVASSIGNYKSSVEDIGSYKSTGTTDYTTSSSNRFSGAGVTSDRFSVPTDNLVRTSDSTASSYTSRDSLYVSKSLPPSSSQSKYFLPSKPLSKSVFGKSPSLDNLFMSSKSTANTVSRFATAEDVHTTGYKSRYSFPSYMSSVTSKNSVGDFSSETGHTGRMSDIGAAKEYSSSSLPPKPVRTRSYSDMGANVASLTSGVSSLSGAGLQGKINTGKTHPTTRSESLDSSVSDKVSCVGNIPSAVVLTSQVSVSETADVDLARFHFEDRTNAKLSTKMDDTRYNATNARDVASTGSKPLSPRSVSSKHMAFSSENIRGTQRTPDTTFKEDDLRHTSHSFDSRSNLPPLSVKRNLLNEDDRDYSPKSHEKESLDSSFSREVVSDEVGSRDILDDVYHDSHDKLFSNMYTNPQDKNICDGLARYSVTNTLNASPVSNASSVALSRNPRAAYSYTDLDLGVNPRNKAHRFSFRTRSASSDNVPVTSLTDGISMNQNEHEKLHASTPSLSASSIPSSSSLPKYSLAMAGSLSPPYGDSFSSSERYPILTQVAQTAVSSDVNDNVMNVQRPSDFSDDVVINNSTIPIISADNRYQTTANAPMYASAKSYVDSPFSFSGSTTVTSGYSKRFGPSAASSSSSSYLPTSLTSITTSSTYTTAQPPSTSLYSSVPGSSSTTYPGTSSSSHPSKSTDILPDGGGRGAYAGYLSNNSTYDFSKSDSFLPEPKKRLFESSDDMDLSLSPIKATRKT